MTASTPAAGQLADRGLEVGQLAGKCQRVERHVTSHAATVQERHHLGQIGPVEVVGTNSRIVALKAEIDGVGTVLNGREQAGSIAGRCQQLRPG